MVKIVITGGIACGKTLFCKYLSRLGFEILDCDHVVHSLEACEGDAVAAVAQEFGQEFILGDGSVNRKKLGQLVFNDKKLRSRLNAIVHPLVEDRVEKWLSDTHQGIPVVVIPLLYELGWEKCYDCVVAVVCERMLQLKRLIEKRSCSEQEAESRLMSQLPLSIKTARADIVVVNNGSVLALRKEAERVERLLKMRYV